MCCLCCCLIFSINLSAKPKGKVWTTYESAKAEDSEFMIQGEFGSGGDGLGVQTVVLGQENSMPIFWKLSFRVTV